MDKLTHAKSSIHIPSSSITQLAPPKKLLQAIKLAKQAEICNGYEQLHAAMASQHASSMTYKRLATDLVRRFRELAAAEERESRESSQPMGDEPLASALQEANQSIETQHSNVCNV